MKKSEIKNKASYKKTGRKRLLSEKEKSELYADISKNSSKKSSLKIPKKTSLAKRTTDSGTSRRTADSGTSRKASDSGTSASVKKASANQRKISRTSSPLPYFLSFLFFIGLYSLINIISDNINRPKEEKMKGMENLGATWDYEMVKDKLSENSGLTFSNGRYIDTSKPLVALTFDDGPSGTEGERILDCLDENNGRATFFLVGNILEYHKNEVKKIYSSGNEIGNHSWSHNEKLFKEDPSVIKEEYDKTDDLVFSLTGFMPSLYRLPGGNSSDNVFEALDKPIISWSVDTEDWKSRSKEEILSKIKEGLSDGAIILLHEIYPQTADAVMEALPYIRDQGYEIVTVSELISLRDPEIFDSKEHKQYFSFR